MPEYKFSDLPNPIELGKTWAGNLKRNATLSITTMEMENWIRVIAILGAYILLRPYLMKLAEKTMTKNHEKEVDPAEVAAADAKVSPNSLRGLVKVQEDTDDEAETKDASGADWGKKARRRQRQMVKKIIDEEEKIRREFEELDDDKDIEQYLT